MAARKTKTDTTELVDEPQTEVVKIVPRPHGLEAVYERQPDGEITRTVRKADPATADEIDGSELEGFDVERDPAEEA